MSDDKKDRFILPQEDTATEAIEAIDEELSLFDDWMDRYQYIIEMGKKLPDFPKEWEVDENKVEGCQSQVWMKAKQDGGKLFFAGTSDAIIVKGLVALVLRVYSSRTAEEIIDTPSQFLHDLGLVKSLSANRGNGVVAMAEKIRKIAANM